MKKLDNPQRRDFLQTAWKSAAVLGAWSLGGAETAHHFFGKNIENFSQINFPAEKLLEEFEKEKENKSDVLFHANKRVIGAENFSRMEYVKHIFQTQKSTIPQGIMKSIAMVIQGLPSIESFGYENNHTSSAQAFGIWQITPDTWDEQVKKIKETHLKKNSFIDQTKIAFHLFESNYSYIFQKDS